MAEQADVVIVGGGVAGSAAAIALCRLGVSRVVLLEASPEGRLRVGETIPPDARRLLGLLGVGARFDAQGHAACHGSASSWGGSEVGYNDHFVHPIAQGWHLDRRRFDAWLAEEATAAGAARRTAARVVDVDRAPSGFRLAIASAGEDGAERVGEELCARLVIDATGLPAAIGRRLGAERLDHDRLIYLACSLASDPGAPRSGQTWLEATESGWWYAAELPGGVWTVAIATDPEIVREEGLSTKDGFFRAFEATKHLSRRLGALQRGGEPPRAWVASSSLLGPPAGEGWMAVGDAAAAYDPICARGIHKALEDGLRAAAAARAALGGDASAIGDFARRHILAFRAYLEQRAYLYAREARWPRSPFWRRRAERRNLARRARSPAEGRSPSSAGAAG